MTQSNPVKLKEEKLRSTLSDPDTPGFVLLLIALYTFGDYVFGDPEQGIEPMDSVEMWVGFNDRWGSWVSEEGENKLTALITGLADAAYWRDLEVFMAVSTALFDGDLGDLINARMEELSATELMWSMLEMQLAWDSEDTPEFSSSIQRYIEKCLSREQEEHVVNSREVEHSYLQMLGQLKDLGVPVPMLRALDEDYADVMENIDDIQDSN